MINAAWLRGFIFGVLCASLLVASVTLADNLYGPKGQYLFGDGAGNYYDSKGGYYFGNRKPEGASPYDYERDDQRKPC